MRKRIIAGNWKMYKGDAVSASELATELAQALGNSAQTEVVLCPPFTALATVAECLKGTRIGLGAQNLYPQPEGAFTGEVSPVFLKAVGCRYVILGHSERRQYFGETNAFINGKVRCALAEGLTPILCCGEQLAEREEGKTEPVVREQILGCLAGVTAQEMPRVVIAYEPVWAIGTGKVATDEQAQAVHAYLRALLAEMYSQAVADQVRIQYGGSVKPDNAAGLLSQPDIDGALVGGASLKSASFAAIVRAAPVA